MGERARKAIQALFSFDAILVLSILLVGSAGFALGRLSMLKNGGGGVEILGMPLASVETSSPSEETPVVASKRGSKYYYPWCAGAASIVVANRIEFPSAEGAETAGYTSAANCSK